MRALVIFTVLMVFSASRLFAEVAAESLAQVAWESELIVVAKITSVSPHGADKSYATARILETWKGKPAQTVEFLAEPWWACDISEAYAGETAVLFLVRGEQSRSYMLNIAGGGRMPLRTVRGQRYATVLGYVILPPKTHTIRGPMSAYPSIRSVRLETLRKLVASTLRVWPPDDAQTWPFSGHPLVPPNHE
jgi:hypothetical protein